MVIVPHSKIPSPLGVCYRMRYGYFEGRLATGFEAPTGVQAKDVRHAITLYLNFLPDFETRGAPLEFDGVETHCPEPGHSCVGARSTNCELAEEAIVALEVKG